MIRMMKVVMEMIVIVMIFFFERLELEFII